ncbi:CD276 antigen-like [Heptranchias perlo]|uniref:CD276 antigen-like n=1 Tax=Heptranchias perlo TaxID=212740 RepID=UPI00355961A8
MERTIPSLSCLLTVQHLLFRGSFAVSPIIALFGRDLTLPCTFNPVPSISLPRLVITWQLVGSDRVVHSYYYQQDQLSKQDPLYLNRTRLFPEGLLAGNASLQLRDVRLSDEATYMCSASSETGSSKRLVQVTVAAPYREPRLTFDLRNCSSRGLLRVHTDGGYPKAEVEWQNGTGVNVTDRAQTEIRAGPEGLYSISSRLLILERAGSNFTFVLTNRLLNQQITRTFAIVGPCAVTLSSRRDRQYLLYTILPAALIMAVFLTAYLAHLRERRAGRGSASEWGPRTAPLSAAVGFKRGEEI